MVRKPAESCCLNRVVEAFTKPAANLRFVPTVTEEWFEMSQEKKLIRQRFRDKTFARDGYKCRACGVSSSVSGEWEGTKDLVLDAHHITDRTLMPNGGYVPENGISLCPVCHEKAEVFHSTGTALPGFSPDELYALIGSSHDLAVKASENLK